MLRFFVLSVCAKPAYAAITTACLILSSPIDESIQVFQELSQEYSSRYLVPPTTSEGYQPQEEPEPAKVDPTELTMKVYSWLKGRVLGCLIFEGMTEKQVDWILGETMLGTTNLTGGTIISRKDYDDLGLSIELSNSNKDNALRVFYVDFHTFFGGPLW
jgi:hypothetical protein